MSDSNQPNFYIVKFTGKPDFIYVLDKPAYQSLLNKRGMNYFENIITPIDGEPDKSEFDIIVVGSPPPPPPTPPPGALIRMVEIRVTTIVNSNELPDTAATVASLLTKHDANTPVHQASIDEIAGLLREFVAKPKEGGKKISLRRKSSSSSRRRRSTKRRTASRKQQKRRRGSRRAH